MKDPSHPGVSHEPPPTLPALSTQAELPGAEARSWDAACAHAPLIAGPQLGHDSARLTQTEPGAGDS